MRLFRVNNKYKKEDDAAANPNYGRFFFARKVQAIDEAGNPKFNDRGYPVEDLADFSWFDTSNYVRSGAFAAAATPELTQLMLHTSGADLEPANAWPVDVKGLAL